MQVLRRSALGVGLVVGALAATMAAPSEAEAELIYGVHVAATSPAMDDGERWPEFGGGFQLRGGYELPIPFFEAEIELLLGGQIFRGDKSSDRLPMLVDARAGMRGGVNWAVFPQGYVHIGYGRAFGYKFGAPQGLIGDIGVAFDVTAIPYIRIGIFGQYNHMMFADSVKITGGDRDLQWFSFGISGCFVDGV